tara:strand:- start:223 stop:414 length:192 start_codon:yes stop_codon:yes gene_type:complete
MILFLLSQLGNKIQSIYSLTEGVNEDMSKKELISIINDISGDVENLREDLAYIMRKKKYFRSV